MSDSTANSRVPDGICVVEPDGLSSEAFTAVLQGAVAASTPHAVVQITGPGALQCLQGLITADVETPGDGSFQYGALLTPKGMIVSDMWVARRDPSLVLYLPQRGKDEVLTTFKRSLPPRLAQFTDRSAERSTLRIVGPRALDVLAQAGLAVPESGRNETNQDVTAARPAQGHPFVLQYEGTAERIDKLSSMLVEAGAVSAPYEALHMSRILAGWPSLNAEIDAKTLPQEVRFDEIDGVSHSKGCYLGQETVARLHSRGHTNKRILGLRFDAKPDTSSVTIMHEDRQVGRITSICWFGPDIGYLGLGMIRREVEVRQTVRSGGATAVTESLPFEASS